jgi:hypothetical protein
LFDMTGPGLGCRRALGRIKFDVKHADDFERVTTVRENKWEHGMETDVGAEANVPKLESIGLSIWSGDKIINVGHDGSTCRSSAPPPADQSQQGHD